MNPEPNRARSSNVPTPERHLAPEQRTAKHYHWDVSQARSGSNKLEICFQKC